MNSLRSYRRRPLPGHVKGRQSQKSVSKLTINKENKGIFNRSRRLIAGQGRKTNNLLPVYLVVGGVFVFAIILIAVMSNNSLAPTKSKPGGTKKTGNNSKVVQVSKEDQEEINKANKSLANSFSVINRVETRLKEGNLSASEARMLLSKLEQADSSMVSALSMLEKIGSRYQQNFYPKSYVKYRRDLQLYRYKLKELIE